MSGAIVPFGGRLYSDLYQDVLANQGNHEQTAPPPLATQRYHIPTETYGPDYIHHGHFVQRVATESNMARQASAMIAVTGTVVAAAATAMFTTAYMNHQKATLSTMYLVLAIACGCCTALIGLIGFVRFMS